MFDFDHGAPRLVGQSPRLKSIEEFTPQPYKPINRITLIGLDLELLNQALKIP